MLDIEIRRSSTWNRTFRERVKRPRWEKGAERSYYLNEKIKAIQKELGRRRKRAEDLTSLKKK